MMVPKRALRILFLLAGIFQMTSAQSADLPRPAAPMTGPDFVMERVVSWKESPGADSQLVLADGSRWHIAPGRRDYDAQVAFVVHALQDGKILLLSGDRTSGEIDRAGYARKLAVEQLGDREVEGRMAIFFFGPPSVYYLRMSRPGAEHDLALLRRSAASGASFSTPDLLVGIDTLAKEVVAVRPLAEAGEAPAAGAGASR